MRYESVRLGESARRKIYSHYKRNAKARGLSFELDYEYFCELIAMDCYYSGHPPMGIGRPFVGQNAKFSVPAGTILYNGIDRKNNDLGYSVENSVTCCKVCNMAKRAMPYEEWTAWVESFSPFGSKNFHKLEYKR